MKFNHTSRLHSATTVDFDNILYLWNWYQPLHKPFGQDAVRCSHEVRFLPLRVLETPLFPLGRLCKSELNMNNL